MKSGHSLTLAANTARLPSSEFATSSLETRWLAAIMVVAASYQAWLCLFYTFGAPTSAAWVGASEAVIMLACLPFLLRRLQSGVLIIALLAGAWFCLAAILTMQFNVKAPRDLLVPLCFLWLGCNVGRPELAERGLIATIAVVLFVGLVELLWLDTFTRYLDIFGYYISTGNLQPITDYVRESRLQLNGLRPEGIGRTLLPGLLGAHRVSSVFLEPVSLGNFATLIAAWGLSRNAADWRNGALFLTAAAVMMILADSRFTLMLLPVLIGMRLLLPGKWMNLAILAPFVAVAAVVFVGLIVDKMEDDDLVGRLAISGWALLRMDLWMYLGLGHQPPFGDMGYAYLLSRFGVPLTLVLWFGFWLMPMPDERGRRFRAFMAVYIALILAVSGTSLFAFKSSALLWLLMGSLLRKPALLTAKPRLQETVNSSWTTSHIAGAPLNAN